MKPASSHLRNRSILDRGPLRADKHDAGSQHAVTTTTPRPAGFGNDRELLTWAEMMEGKPGRSPRPHSEGKRTTLLTSIKKIFRPPVKPPSDVSSPSIKRTKHEHANSEPMALHGTFSTPAPSPMAQPCPAPQRAVSMTTSRNLAVSRHFSRPTPHAIEFPCSARLKPLNLGTPTIAPASRATSPGRRQSLPELDTRSTAPRYAAPFSPIVEQSPEVHHNKRLSELEDVEKPKTSLRPFRRRSRSESNLKRKSAEASNAKKGEDNYGWRDDVQYVVRHASELRNSGRRLTPPQPDQCCQGDVSPIIGTSGTTVARDNDTGKCRTPPTSCLDMSRDLEDRVAKLEAGVQDFQDALRYLTGATRADSAVRSDLQKKIPSFLTHSLHIVPSGGSLSEGTTLIVNGPPRSPTPLSNASIENKRHRATSTGKSSSPENVSSSAFMTLYEMMEGERAARMELEHRVQDLHQDLAELKCHVAIKPTVGYGAIDRRRYWAMRRFSRSYDDVSSQSSSRSSPSPRSSADEADDTMPAHEWHFDADDEIF